MKKNPASPDQDTSRFWTLPNVLCVVRFIGSFALLPLALADQSYWFVGLYLMLITSDLIDGPIARKFHQRSDSGAHLDSIADITLNACLLAGVARLCWTTLQHELLIVGLVIGSYCLSQAFGFWKYRRLLSYHTYIAKFSQWLAMLAAVSLILEWSVWPLHVASIIAILGNLEAIAITAVLKRWQTDVQTLFRAWPSD
ncbi:MAG: CDP-alcohol phosphatidyltransferase family protein [Verrucomicrobiales bacterium]